MMMSVSGEHNELCFWLRSLMQFYVEGKSLGIVRGPQFPCRLVDQRREPDLMFISNDRKTALFPNHLEGPPDLALEIVSPESQSRDWREKYIEYQATGVHEYWIVDPMSQVIEAYALGGSGVYQRIALADGKISSAIVPGWYIKPEWLWQKPRASVLQMLTELGIR